MMGERRVDQAALFYTFSLEDHVPANHLLRSIDRFVELEGLRATALWRHGPPIVSAALTSIAEAYEGQALTYEASIFGALIKLFANPPEGFDPDDLVPTLKRLDLASVGETVRGLSGGDSRAVAKADDSPPRIGSDSWSGSISSVDAT